jgi:hypothetical protein
VASKIRFSAFPRTEPAPPFTRKIIDVFRKHEESISTDVLKKGLTSDDVLGTLQPELSQLGFTVEKSKSAIDKIKRPVFFGENGVPRIQYEIDAFNEEWKCGLEVEAGRAWMGNAIYRDLIQAMVMVQLATLVLAVPNCYRYKSAGRDITSQDYERSCNVADALFGHTRIHLPYSLVLVGY